MNENNEELMLLLKALVSKINELEKAVYNKDNLLMKAGWVQTTTPSPRTGVLESNSVDNIAKMDWDEINEMVSKMEQKGGY